MASLDKGKPVYSGIPVNCRRIRICFRRIRSILTYSFLMPA